MQGSMIRPYRPPMLRPMQYGFPPTEIEPGQMATVSKEIRYLFRAEKIVLSGLMNEVRGRFWLKHSRLPLLDSREVVYAATRIYKQRRGRRRWFRRGKTTVTFPVAGLLVTREYRPENVVYEDVDPLEYITLRQVFIGTRAQMPIQSEGAPAQFFGIGNLSNGVLFDEICEPSTMSMTFENVGDIKIKVAALVFGSGKNESRTEG
jgi:hypothetical protein